MNCLDFRRLCLADPNTTDNTYYDHRQRCSECDRYALSIESQDEKLLEMLKVEIPEGLESRIKLTQLVAEQTRKPYRVWHYALAASLIVSVGIGGLFGYRLYSVQTDLRTLQAAVIEHLGEDDHLLTANIDQSANEEFKRALAQFGGQLMSEVSFVSHAAICPMNDAPVIHAVVRSEKGTVSVIYTQGKALNGTMNTANTSKRGMIVPFGNGSLAVVGESEQQLKSILDQLRKTIRWKI